MAQQSLSSNPNHFPRLRRKPQDCEHPFLLPLPRNHNCPLCLYGVVSSGYFVQIKLYREGLLGVISFSLRVSKVSRCHGTYQHFISFYRQIKFHCMGILYSPYPFLSWWTFEYLCFAVVIGIAAMNIHLQLFMWICFYFP